MRCVAFLKVMCLNLKSGAFFLLQAQQRGSQEFDFEMFQPFFFFKSSHGEQHQIVIYYYSVKGYIANCVLLCCLSLMSEQIVSLG